jgi:hypothetical protein
MNPVEIAALDALDLLVVVDNESDTLSSVDKGVPQLPELGRLVARVPHLAPKDGHDCVEPWGHLCLACHGFSALVTGRLIRECHWAGYPSSEGFENALDIHRAMSNVLALRISGSELELASRALKAQQEGLTATAEEADALQRCNAEWFQLARLGGLEVSAATGVPEEGPR